MALGGQTLLKCSLLECLCVHWDKQELGNPPQAAQTLVGSHTRFCASCSQRRWDSCFCSNYLRTSTIMAIITSRNKRTALLCIKEAEGCAWLAPHTEEVPLSALQFWNSKCHQGEGRNPSLGTWMNFPDTLWQDVPSSSCLSTKSTRGGGSRAGWARSSL